MKAEIKIPKGWRIIRSNEQLKPQDRFANLGLGSWITLWYAQGLPLTGFTYIRRKRKARA